MNAGDLGINAHRLAQRLDALGSVCLFVDVGVRAGVSSDIMLRGWRERGNNVIGIDTNVCPPHLVHHDAYQFFQSDSVTQLAEIASWAAPHEKIDAGMCDTLHIAEQVMCETFYLWPVLRVGGFLAFHDTAWPDFKKDHYLGRDWDRPEVGVARLFANRPEVKIEQFDESWGMMFVHKLAEFDLRPHVDWRPVFEARNQLLALVPDGVTKRELWP